MGRRVLPVVIAFMLLVAACGGTSDSGSTDQSATTVTIAKADIPTDLALVAQLTCNQMGGATAASATPIITKAMPRASAIGYSGQDLRAALQAECSDVMDSILSDAGISSLFEG